MRFTRVPFGNTASPFLLCATIKHHLSLNPPSTARTELEENLYMDDWLSGCDSEKEAKEMFRQARDLMKGAGMELAKWSSNNSKVSKEIGDKTVIESHKVLGLKWSPQNDSFSFDGIEVSENLCLTKRLVLSLVSRLFDPLGFLNPFVIRAKILFQNLWREEYDWDQTLSDEWKEWFGDWLKELVMLKGWSIPRRYLNYMWSENPSLVLHGFGDASPQAYGACVYLVRMGQDKSCESSLVISRARVAPLKEVTLPRLELLAALLVARLIEYVQNALKLGKITSHCWTDSTIALSWIRGQPHQWKTFVANRVTEIQQLTDISCWRHCPGVKNPADLTTRGVTAAELMTSDCWLEGPKELFLDVEGFSHTEKISEEESKIVVTEQKNTSVQSTANVCLSPNQPSFPVERWGSWTKAI